MKNTIWPKKTGVQHPPHAYPPPAECWMKTYDYSPVFIEFFTQAGSIAGTFYQAASRQKIGFMEGNEKLGRNALWAVLKKIFASIPYHKFQKAALVLSVDGG